MTDYKSFLAGVLTGKKLGMTTGGTATVSAGSVVGDVSSYDQNSFLSGLAVGRSLWKPLQKIARVDIGAVLLFESQADFTLKVYDETVHWQGTIEYSTNGISWATWDATQISSAGGKLYLRGTGNRRLSDLRNPEESRWVFTATNSIDAEGTIETLMDYQYVERGEHPPYMYAGAFEYLFKDNTALRFPPDFTAVRINTLCYRGTFEGCTSLLVAPALPATTLYGSCYMEMFDGCTSLVSAPRLNATEMVERCYYWMFRGCTALMDAPALPATQLAQSCYESMFAFCTRLSSAPELPATELAERCYRYMFSDCTSLTIPAQMKHVDQLAVRCCENMYSECTSIKRFLPSLMAADMPDNCYRSMFYCNNSDGILLSTTQDAQHPYPFVLPTTGQPGIIGTNATYSMFGGYNVPTPTPGITYYCSAQTMTT